MANITFSGFNGFDFKTIIDATIQAESQPLTSLQNQQQAIQNKDAALASLSTLLDSLHTQAKSLADPSIFTNVAAASSDTAVVTPTAGDGASAGEYAINVTKLAKMQVTASTSSYATTDAIAADGGSISFTINGETTTAIDITSATTLASLKDSINSQNTGVLASLVNTGSSYKLVISSRATGESNGFVINNSITNSNGTAVAFAAGQGLNSGNSQNAQDAALSVNGLNITNGSNTISDAIPGVTLTLTKESQATIKVTADYGALKEALQTLVTQYNKLRKFANDQHKTDTITGATAPLANEPVLRQALGDIRDVLLGASSNGGQYQYLSEIGLELTQSGDLSLNQSRYTTAIDSHAADLQKLFQGSGAVKGVFGNLETNLQNLDGTSGFIHATRDSIKTTLTGFRDRIVAQQLRLDMRRQQLQAQYAAADQAISKLSSMTSQLASLQG